MAATTTLVVAVAFAVLAHQLTSRERTRLLESKTQAANMLVSLVATSLSAAIDFGDMDDVRTWLEHLRSNPEITAAIVYPPTGRDALAEWHRDRELVLSSEPEGTRVGADDLAVTRFIRGAEGRTIARVTVVFSLAAENNEYRTNRVRILFGASISAVVIAALLVVLSRYQIVRPLRRLAYAAGRLEQGDMSARAGIASDDEIGALSRAFDTMGCAVADRHQRLAQEVEIAERIQTSILPRRLEVASLDISAAMVPASEVGGDYYDVLRTTDGCWLGVGDVSGHGLNAGLVMLMMQSMVSVLTKERPDAAPREIVSTLNRALFDSVRERLDMEHHATLTLLRYRRDGRVVFAGAHEEVIVWRAATKRCELFETPGTWVAGVRDVADATIDTALVLDAGDVMVLHTDGVTEARNSDGRMFGIERLCSEIERAESTSAASIQGHLIDAVKKWTHVQHDDITILVAKYQPNAP